MNTEKTSKKLDKKIIIIAAAAVLVIAAVIVIICLSGKGEKRIDGNSESGNGQLSEQNNEESTDTAYVADENDSEGTDASQEESASQPEAENAEDNQPEEEPQKTGKEELVDVLINEVKVMGLSVKEFNEMSREEAFAYAMDNYGLEDYYQQGAVERLSATIGDENYAFTVFEDDWSLNYNGDFSVCSLSNDPDGESRLWICAVGDCAVVTLPEDFFSLEDSVDVAKAWCEQRGVQCAYSTDPDNNSNLDLSVKMDDGKYMNLSFSYNGNLSIEISNSGYEWAMN